MYEGKKQEYFCEKFIEKPLKNIKNLNMVKIDNVEKKDKNLSVKWSDGEQSNFNYLWLRDNCPTAHDKDSNHRMFNILEVSKDINPKNYSLNDEGKLKIEWSEGNHTSYYDPKWLRENCYTINNKKKYISPYQLWDNSLSKNFESIYIDHDEIINSDKGLVKWLELLHHKGIAIVKNAPIEKKSAFDVLHRISHVRETFFKTPFEVINIPKPNNSAYTAHALRNHMDLPWFELPPGYQFLHCLINDAQGGDSSAIDGFAVAEYLKKNHKDLFKILTKTKVRFRFVDKTIILENWGELIELNENDKIKQIRYSTRLDYVPALNKKELEKFYEARKLIADLYASSKFEIKFRLKKGDLLMMDNHRLLHGRTSYDISEGNRYLKGCYIDHDSTEGKLRHLERKFGLKWKK